MAFRNRPGWTNYGSRSKIWKKHVETPIRRGFGHWPAVSRVQCMDLILTHGYFLYEDAKELQIMKPYVPLGILYLASHLRARNFDVEVFDTTFSSRADLLNVLHNTGPAVLGVYANTITRPSVDLILAS